MARRPPVPSRSVSSRRMTWRNILVSRAKYSANTYRCMIIAVAFAASAVEWSPFDIIAVGDILILVLVESIKRRLESLRGKHQRVDALAVSIFICNFAAIALPLAFA